MHSLSNDLKRDIAVFLCATVIFSMLAYVAVTPRPREDFFQIYVLGSTRKADSYYPSNDSSVPVGRKVDWYLGVTNSMGSIQYVVVRAKLGNSTIKAPDDASFTPSPAPVLLEFSRALANNETWKFLFQWNVQEIVTKGSTINPAKFEINGISVQNNYVSALNGYNLRMIFELWTFSPQSGNIELGWKTGTERRIAWLQVWFNVTSQVTRLPILPSSLRQSSIPAISNGWEQATPIVTYMLDISSPTLRQSREYWKTRICEC